MAEFTEEADTWLTSDLLTAAIDPELKYHPYDKPAKGTFYAGLDLAERVDHGALAIVNRVNNRLRLVHLHQFKLREQLTYYELSFPIISHSISGRAL